MKFIIYRSSAA